MRELKIVASSSFLSLWWTLAQLLANFPLGCRGEERNHNGARSWGAEDPHENKRFEPTPVHLLTGIIFREGIHGMESSRLN